MKAAIFSNQRQISSQSLDVTYHKKVDVLKLEDGTQNTEREG